jgi:hypothetical protein
MKACKLHDGIRVFVVFFIFDLMDAGYKNRMYR